MLALAALAWCIPRPGGAQEVLWPTSSDNQVDLEFARPERASSAPSFAYHPGAVWLQGALLVRVKARLTERLQLVADLPLAHLSGKVNSCVDASCPRFHIGDIIGDPLVGLRYSVPGRSLWLEGGFRAPLMDLDPWEPGPSVDRWGRQIDQMAVFAAQAAEGGARDEAFLPHAWTASLDAVSRWVLGGGWGAQARGGLAWIVQQPSDGYRVSYPASKSLDFRYDLRIMRRAGPARLAGGLLGRGRLVQQSERGCGIRGPHCRIPTEAEVTASWAEGSVRPALQLRLPLLGTPKQAVRWTLAAGLRLAWGGGG